MVGGLGTFDHDLFNKWHCLSCGGPDVRFVRTYRDLAKAQALLPLFLNDAFHYLFTVRSFLWVVREENISY